MKIYKVVLDNEETRFFLTESDIREYLENNKFLYLVEESTNEELLVNIDHIVTVTEVRDIALKFRYKL